MQCQQKSWMPVDGFRPLVEFRWTTLHPNLQSSHSKIAIGIRRWPANLAKLAAKEKPPILPAMFKAGIEHELERQNILKIMLSLIIQANQNESICLKTPLEKLEQHEFKGREKYRFIRKYFSELLPPRKRKNKKRSPAKISRKEKKRAERRRLDKEKLDGKLQTKTTDDQQDKTNSKKAAKRKHPKNGKLLQMRDATYGVKPLKQNAGKAKQQCEKNPKANQLWANLKSTGGDDKNRADDGKSTLTMRQIKKNSIAPSFCGVDFRNGYSSAEFQQYMTNYQEKN